MFAFCLENCSCTECRAFTRQDLWGRHNVHVHSKRLLFLIFSRTMEINESCFSAPNWRRVVTSLVRLTDPEAGAPSPYLCLSVFQCSGGSMRHCSPYPPLIEHWRDRHISISCQRGKESPASSHKAHMSAWLSVSRLPTKTSVRVVEIKCELDPNDDPAPKVQRGETNTIK